MKVAFTGHRPTKIGGYDRNNPIRQEIKAEIERVLLKLRDENPDLEVISGGALGIDQDAARVAHRLGIPFHVYMPFAGQERKWPMDSQQSFLAILNVAKSVKIVSEGGYSASKMQIRNRAMVDDADVLIAVWDGTSGGTKNCIDYAEGKVDIIFIGWSGNGKRTQIRRL